MSNLKLSGLLHFFAGSIVLLGIIKADAFYPAGYITFKNEISDLGSTRQPNSVSFEPSSTIDINAPIQFVLRTEYLKNYPEPVALRRPINSFVKVVSR